nr:rhodanese-like domain-containing protein [uncultured Cellulosilyticum sp.]
MSIEKLNVQEAKANLDTNKEIILIDIRSRAEYEEGHIPGCIHIPLPELEMRIEEVAPDFDQPIYYYCRSGVRTLTAGAILEHMGYTNLYDMGGIMSWPYEIEK